MAAVAWISSSKSNSFFISRSSFSPPSILPHHHLSKSPKFDFHRPIVKCTSSSSSSNNSNNWSGSAGASELKLVLHDALDLAGLNTANARAARVGFCSQIKKFSHIERETSISINRAVDLSKAALHIAAEDDSLVSHSSVPLPVDDFIDRLYNLSMDFCSHYSSALGSSPQKFLECLERYLYVSKGFRRTNARNQVEQHALYLNSVLTHRSGSVYMISLIYSEILKMLRMLGFLNFDVEIFVPHDTHSSPRGYQKHKSKISDEAHIMTSQALLVEILKDLKYAFWPFQLDLARSPFLRAAQAAHCLNGSNSTRESASELASAKAARHRLQRGVWTSVRFGDIRRALAACERLILLEVDPKELRDYAVLLYHCGFYEESLEYLKQYQATKGADAASINLVEEDAVEKLIIRLNLILMEEGWSTQSEDNRGTLFNNSEPW